jgi:hypothetical protein
MTGAVQNAKHLWAANHGCFNTQARAWDTPIALVATHHTLRIMATMAMAQKKKPFG